MEDSDFHMMSDNNFLPEGHEVFVWNKNTEKGSHLGSGILGVFLLQPALRYVGQLPVPGTLFSNMCAMNAANFYIGVYSF